MGGKDWNKKKKTLKNCIPLSIFEIKISSMQPFANNNTNKIFK